MTSTQGQLLPVGELILDGRVAALTVSSCQGQQSSLNLGSRKLAFISQAEADKRVGRRVANRQMPPMGFTFIRRIYPSR